jgi:hypothetical protein
MMTKQEDEKIRVLNSLVWLQVSIDAGDACENIKWFYNKQTKFYGKRYNDAIMKEHGRALLELWDVEEVNMQMVMKEIYDFSAIVTRIPFYRIREATNLLTKHFENE